MALENVTLPTRAGLVPFTLHSHDKEKLDCLSGIGVASITSNDRASFSENMLFTHRGLSGPAMLQISSYWQPGEAINVNLMPSIDLYDYLQAQQQQQPQQQLKTSLSQLLPKRVVNVLLDDAYASRTLANLSDNDMQHISHEFQGWQVKPNGTEGYRTAEVTLGGVDCDQLSSKTFEVNNQPGLYFLGEVLDVTGWLGGYNFQWAWSSGWAAGQAIAARG